MRHPRLLVMRHRLVELTALAEESRKNGKDRQAVRILYSLGKGEITYREALAKLGNLAKQEIAQPRTPQGYNGPSSAIPRLYSDSMMYMDGQGPDTKGGGYVPTNPIYPGQPRN